MGTHLRVLSKSFPMNTNTTGFICFQKSSRPCALDERNLNIGNFNPSNAEATSVQSTRMQIF